jgi:O-methyltransferase involved in polyketide biosynthesis
VHAILHRQGPGGQRPHRHRAVRRAVRSIRSHNLDNLSDTVLRMRERLGLDVNIQALTYPEFDRSNPAQWLADHSWQVHGVNKHEEMARLGRPVPEDLADEAVRGTLLRARLGGLSN